jgi:predicted transposase YbfD/YdcC
VDLKDPRADRGLNHVLQDIIGIALCGMICGADTFADMERFAVSHEDWFADHLELPHGIPSHDTIRRVFERLDVASLQSCLQSWVEQMQLSLQGETVAIDGKTSCGSHDHKQQQKALHLVHAWATRLTFCLGQVRIDDKSNEIPAVQELLGILRLKGAVVTADAMHCQKETARRIIEREADYILQVKDNQPKLLDEITTTFLSYEADNYESREVRCAQVKERNRGRKENRVCMVAPAPQSRKQSWPGLATIGLVSRSRQLADGTQQSEVSYFISSLPPRARDHATRIRDHWKIENTLHHTLDVTFHEDQSRIRSGCGPQVMSLFRKLALTILKKDTTIKDNIRGKRLRAGWNLNDLKKILLAFQAF